MKAFKRFLIRRLPRKLVPALRAGKAAMMAIVRPRLLLAARDAASAGRSDNYGIRSDETRLGLLWPWNYEISRTPRRMASGRPWPRISIVTVTFNQGQFLEETIRSVLLQGYPNLEYIVVDGASTDNTKRILDRYRGEISVVLSEPDEGQSDALNKGFRHATGAIQAWLNSDDQFFPDTLVRVAEAFDRYRTDMVVGGTAIIRGFERAPSAEHHCALPRNAVVDLPLEKMVDFLGEWQRGDFFYQPEVFWSKDLWQRSGACVGSDLRYAMDYELWLRFASHGAKVVHISDMLAIFRVHEAQKTKWREGEDYPEHMAVSRRYLGEHGARAAAKPSAAGPGIVPADIALTIPRSVFDRRPVAHYTTPLGVFYVPSDAMQDEAAKAIRAGGIYRPDMLSAAARYARRGTTVLDVGAGFGQTAIALSNSVGDAGQVLAFEADEYVLDILQKTIQANGRENVRVFLGAAFDGSCESVSFPKVEYSRFPSYCTQRIAHDAGAGTPRVASFALDTLHISGEVSLLQVHTGGSELSILRGARALIRANRMPILVDFDEDLHREAGQSRRDFEVFLEEIDYRIEETLHTCCHVILPRGGAPSMAESDPRQIARPQPRLSSAAFRSSLCKILNSRSEIEQCTRYLKRNGFVSHNLICKDWDLAHIVPEIEDGNFLDMGSSDSYVLKNVCLKRTRGEKHGIDLQKPDVPLKEVNYMIGDLMNTKLPGGHFSYITCLSVLEHQVDYDRFAAEVSRLLRGGGRLLVTFDYWDPKLTPPIKLYGLAWQPLDRDLACRLFAACERRGLHLVQDFDWTIGDPVIRWGYYSPHPQMQYTFALAVFEKRV